MPRDAEHFRPDIVLAAEAAEPIGAAAQDGRRDRDGLDIVDGAGTAIQTGHGRERRFQPRLTFLALQAFQQRGLLAADIGAGAAMHIDVKRPAGAACVRPQQPRLIGLVHGAVERRGFVVEFTADIDVSRVRAHRKTGDETAFDQLVRVVPQDVAVLASTGLALVAIDDEIVRSAFGLLLGHEGPLQAGREARPAAAAQAGGLHLLDDPVTAFLDNRLGVVPVAARTGPGEARIVQPVQVGENAILVLQHQSAFAKSRSVSTCGPPTGAEVCRSICGP